MKWFAYLSGAICLPPQLDLAEFALSNGRTQNVIAKLDYLVALPRVIVSASTSAATLLGLWLDRCSNGLWGSFILTSRSRDGLGLCLGHALLLPFQINLRL